MGMLIKNEFYKLKREWFMAFLLLLSLLPILTGGAGAVFNNSTKSLADSCYDVLLGGFDSLESHGS